MLIRKKIRRKVSVQDTETLEFVQEKCRTLYNWWIICWLSVRVGGPADGIQPDSLDED